MAKEITGAPFGVRTLRFHQYVSYAGNIHWSHLNARRTCQPIPPNHYDTSTHKCFGKNRTEILLKGPDWQRAYDVSRLATLPKCGMEDTVQEKRELKRKLGPGCYDCYDLNSFGDTKAGKLSSLQSKTKRFPDPNTCTPFFYGKGGIPHTLKEESDYKRKNASNVGILNNDRKYDRGYRITDCYPPPGYYGYTNSVDEAVKKQTGKRGPFDICTGDRFKSHKSFLNISSKSRKLGPGQYEYRDFLTESNKTHNVLRGTFGKDTKKPPINRIFWFTLSQVPRDPMHQVGPGTYDPYNPNFYRSDFRDKELAFLTDKPKVNDNRKTRVIKFPKCGNSPGYKTGFDYQRKRYDLTEGEN